MSKKILIIEDDYIIRMFLEQVIASIGYSIIGTADNCKDGLSLINKHNPNIVLTDIGIPGEKDGIETAEIIRVNYKIPVIFITGNSDPATLKRANAVRPIHIIRKPIDEDMLKKEFNEIHKKLNLLKA